MFLFHKKEAKSAESVKPAPAVPPQPETVPSAPELASVSEIEVLKPKPEPRKGPETAIYTKPDAKKAGGMKTEIKLPFKFFSSISVQEKINFARHLSVAIKSGLPLLEALDLIKNQAASKRLTKIVLKVMEDVNNGQSLAQALGRYQETFGDFFISMVRVGEASGNLASSLLYLSTELKKQREISGKAKSAMIYPSVVLLATVGMSVGLTVFIFPKILPIFTSLHVELPFSTRMVIAMMTFLQTKGVYTAIGLVVLFIIMRFLIRIKKLHFYFDKLVLALPVVSNLVIATTLANFTRSLSVLLKSGMTIMDALAVTKVTFHNLYYQYHVQNIIDVVRRGEEMAHYMATDTRLFPPMLTGMIKVGENTGNLEENLLYLSEYYTEEVQTNVQNLTSLLEPLLVLVMGIVVGFIALSIIMPIYSITQGLKVK